MAGLVVAGARLGKTGRQVYDLACGLLGKGKAVLTILALIQSLKPLFRALTPSRPSTNAIYIP